MLLFTVISLLPIVLCMSLAETTTTFPKSHRPTPTPLHSHARSSASTSSGSPLVKVKQDHSSETPTYTSWDFESTSFTSALPTTSQCPSLQFPCGSIGCYDPITEQCCDEKSICKTTQNCVEVQLQNGTTAAGCCPTATWACDGICFDASTSKCCAAPGGTYGLCSANQDCCGNMCCDEGAVCASGFAVPMCWQKHNNSTEGTESSISLPATAATPITQTSGSMKTKVPKLFRILMFLVQSVAGSPEQAFLATRPQSPPIQRGTEIPDMSNSTSPLDKRWWCIEPLETCGDGCRNVPTQCCQQEDRTYGICDEGDVCCQAYCCPSGTTCMIATGAHSYGPWCWPPGLRTTTENVPFDANPWPPNANLAGLKNARIKNGSTRKRPSTVLCIIVCLLSLVAANSALQLVSMDVTTKDVDNSAVAHVVTVSSNTPTGVSLDIEVSEKKGAAGGHGSGAHGHGGSGGHNNVRPGGGAPGSSHRSTAVRPAVPRLFRLFV